MTRTPGTRPRTLAETRFIALMTELFQLDEAEALDFGIYRLIRRHNREVRAFLGELAPGPEGPVLHGGRLSALLDQAFAAAGDEAQAAERERLDDLAQALGLTASMTRDAREARLDQLALIPALRGQVEDYRAVAESLARQAGGGHDRAEVLNRLYQFFARHYQDGDFICERRYGKGGTRYLRSTGEDTEFHWATEDMYYIKSGDTFTDFPVRLSNGRRLCFAVEPAGLAATRAALKPNDRAHYALAGVSTDDGVIRVLLDYRKGAQGERHKEEIVAAVLKAGAGGGATGSAEVRRWLNRFIARNQSDFFIHKRLAAALTEDLDLFIKTEVLDLDQVLSGSGAADLTRRALKVGRLVRGIGVQIIDFLAALEDFQKALWEKKKLVLATRYVITLDRLDRQAPDWLAGQIATIVAAQRAEWAALGLGDYPDPDACRRTTEGDLVTPAHTRWLPLPVDTGNFPEDFKWSLLAAVSAVVPLDEALDGVAIHSDNWQALSLLRETYCERVRCIYIDPPYNTGGDGFQYKDSYQSASWLPSVIEIDGRSGANDLTNLFGEAQRFKNPKTPALLQELLPYAVGAGDLVLDYFGGSGTTAHAVMRLNGRAGIGLRWLLIESGHHLEGMIVPRVKKAAFALDWLKGAPSGDRGPGAFVRIQRLEQYEDTLESLDTEAGEGDTAELPFEDPAFALRYRLDRASRDLYCALGAFRSPFGYRLRRAEGAGAAQSTEVDLVESLAYLLGADITRLYREPAGVVLLGRNRRGQTLGLFFRDCTHPDSADWVAAKLDAHPAERVFTNDPAALAFPGAERLEAIEAVFALQFRERP